MQKLKSLKVLEFKLFLLQWIISEIVWHRAVRRLRHIFPELENSGRQNYEKLFHIPMNIRY